MPAFPWLLTGLAALAERIVSWFVSKGIKTGAFFLGYATLIVGMYSAFLVSTLLAVNALRPVVPTGVAFGMAFLPPSTTFYMNAYFTVLIAKRVFDWHKQITRDFTQATLNF